MPTRIKKIEFDTSLPENTSPQTNPFLNMITGLGRSLNVYGRNMFSHVLKSGTFWALAIFLPLLVLLFNYIFIIGAYSYSMGGVDLFPQFPDLNSRISIPDLPDINYAPAVPPTTVFYSNVISQIFVSGPMVLSLIVLPAFLASSRESNLLKRLKLTGVSKEQMFFTYIILSVALIIAFILVFLGPVIIILGLIASSIFELDINGDLIHAFYSQTNLTVTGIFPDGTTEIFTDVFSGGMVFNPQLIFIIIIGLFGITISGYLFGMKSNSSRRALNIGLGLWITASILNGFTLLLWEVDTFNIEATSNAFSNFLLSFILTFIKYLYFITPVTLYNVAISVAANPALGDKISGAVFGKPINNIEIQIWLTYGFMWAYSIFIIVYAIIKNRKITNFSAGR